MDISLTWSIRTQIVKLYHVENNIKVKSHNAYNEVIMLIQGNNKSFPLRRFFFYSVFTRLCELIDLNYSQSVGKHSCKITFK